MLLISLLKKLYLKITGHPHYWLEHVLLMLLIGVVRWDYAVVVALTIEGVQIEGIWRNGHCTAVRWYLKQEDLYGDLIADTLGILLGIYLRSLI